MSSEALKPPHRGRQRSMGCGPEASGEPAAELEGFHCGARAALPMWKRGRAGDHVPLALALGTSLDRPNIMFSLPNVAGKQAGKLVRNFCACNLRAHIPIYWIQEGI